MKNILFVMLFTFVGFASQAQEKTRAKSELSEAKNKNAKYDIEVNGNCEQCKKRIEKAAYSVSGVKSAVWHIDDHTLHLILNEEKASVLDVKKAIAKAGHDTDEVKAVDEDYKKLPGCCLYERK
jgi:copper chaperone CopZ